MLTGGTLANRLHTQKIRASADATVSAEGQRHDLLAVDADRQALTALTAAVRENLRATARGHTGAKAVRTEAARVVRLIGAFRLCHGYVRERGAENTPSGERVKLVYAEAVFV